MSFICAGVAGLLLSGCGVGFLFPVDNSALGTNHDPNSPNAVAATILNRALVLAPLIGATDADGDSLSLAGKTDGAHGIVALNADGTITYTPDSGFTGTDTISIVLADNHGGQSTWSALIYVADLFTWMGTAGDGKWSTATNWAGDVVPGNADIARFTGACLTKCSAQIDVNVDVKGLAFDASYTDTLTQSAGHTIAIGSAGWSQAGGRFVGSNADITLTTGTFALTGSASFQSTSAVLGLYGYYCGSTGNCTMNVFTVGANATFQPGTGTLKLAAECFMDQPGYQFSIGGASLDLNHLIVDNLAGYNYSCNPATVRFIVPAGKTITVTGNLTQSSSQLWGGTYRLLGNLAIGASAAGGTSIAAFDAAGTHTYAYAAGGTGPGISVTNASAIVQPAGGTTALQIGAPFNLAAGTFVAPTGIFSLASYQCSSWNCTADIFTLSASATFTHSSGTLKLAAECSQDAPTYRFNLGQTLSLHNLTVDNSAGYNYACTANNVSFVVPASQTVDVTNTLSVVSGQLSGNVL